MNQNNLYAVLGDLKQDIEGDSTNILMSLLNSGQVLLFVLM